MKRIALTLSALLIFCSVSMAQISFRTGSPELEIELNSANKSAKSDPIAFKRELSDLHNIGISKVDELLRVVTEPAEALLALRISSVTRKPIDVVMRSYSANRDKGWGAIAKDMGIKPGSPEFHALKGKTKSTGKPSNAGGPGKSGKTGNKSKKK